MSPAEKENADVIERKAAVILGERFEPRDDEIARRLACGEIENDYETPF
ncbi:hypothetical protein [Microvirga pudoricolor]|nr:hypothetical protein [Microvirga pudoricolor]MBM6595407.1 hypothetical protein [Microvirga pudoricolor]